MTGTCERLQPPRPQPAPTQLDRLETKLNRIEKLLTALLDAVADEADDGPEFDLEGNQLPEIEGEDSL